MATQEQGRYGEVESKVGFPLLLTLDGTDWKVFINATRFGFTKMDLYALLLVK